ncbi:MAG: 50S ribosomal protein L15 [Deltaproteobacteria bacterium RIFCSPLOWO2_02_FULL_46_8]|nr:MAG: 50S ribosomal protein L15 [Deltaproteobacteria bacterium RIFCSPLOWO2_02_FULL_46_8]
MEAKAKQKTRRTLTLNTLSPLTRRKKSKRIGRGDGSGHGSTATKGHKGQRARAGGYHKIGFEGGQMPMARRLPKRGFTSRSTKEIGIVNLEQLAPLSKGTEVNLDLAKKSGWVSNKTQYLKILGNGELKHPLTIKADKVSKSAKLKIEAAGGSVESGS